MAKIRFWVQVRLSPRSKTAARVSYIANNSITPGSNCPTWVIDVVVFSALLPPDWLVITLTILAVIVILLVCAVVAKRRRSDFFFFSNHLSHKPKGKKK